MGQAPYRPHKLDYHIKMSLLKSHFCFLILLCLCMSCTKHKADSKDNLQSSVKNQKTLELKKIRDFVLKPGESRIGKIEAPMLVYESASDKKLVFYDTGLNQIIISDSTGTVVSVFGGVGSGPEEFRHISSFGLDGNIIIVYDSVLDMVKKFNMDGDFLESYQGLLDDGIWIRSNRLYTYDGNIYFGIQESGKSNENDHWLSRTIAVYNKNGDLKKLIGEFDPSLENSGLLYNYVNITMSEDGSIYTTHRTSPYIQKFNSSGEKLSRLDVFPKYFKTSDERPHPTAPREVKNRINMKYSFVGDSFVSEDYFLFYYFNFTEEAFKLRNPNDLENYIQVYNRNDKYLGDIKLPYYPIGFDNKNLLYLLEDDNSNNLKIGLYEILF